MKSRYTIEDLKNIPEDEPVFIIRAKDVTAPAVIQHWAELAAYYGAKEEMVDQAAKLSLEVVEWQRVHGMKIPDMG